MVREIKLGEKINNLTVIDVAPSYTWISKKGKHTVRRQFYCKCSCGSFQLYSANKLKNNKIKWCKKCAYANRKQSLNRQPDLERLFNLTIKRAEKNRNIEVSLTLKEFNDIIKRNCFYCGVEPRTINYLKIKIEANGVDRIDNNLGYTKDNCVACCKHCNIAKSTLTQPQFKELIKNIYNYWGKND